MSFELACAWVKKLIRHPPPRKEALNLLQRAFAEQQDATLIVGSNLTTNGKCYLSRWTGFELLAIELSDHHQSSMAIERGTLFCQLAGHRDAQELPPEQYISVTDFWIRDIHSTDATRSVSGQYQYSFDDPTFNGISSGALCVEYFRPDLRRRILQYHYHEGPIIAPRDTLKFQFGLLNKLSCHENLQGTVVLFLQMFRADNWTTRKGVQAISNVASKFIEIQK